VAYLDDFKQFFLVLGQKWCTSWSSGMGLVVHVLCKLKVLLQVFT